ncbi:Hydrogen peroxide-inducible genes activator [Methylophaga frappieri]|uniref:Hydrogen peroxide-inducible genes activator n=1 Tax=Methylophaga frappieri (strain ATCC BAA-2434 / DSM 25690 / JAM7) TaxID=754477 RepID=I1YL20_METFJ|nr:hydrogen peroxide-inducible genes activator [Methylophaga frappieri]AFJ03613.1 Hydrogen peroxide-inducible genes activator [Methylophaga frappieri]
MISIKQLSYALSVEDTLHFKRAAEECNISPSALSTALNELEKQLGLKIFERDNRKVLVTPIGRRVLLQARFIMLQVDDLQHFADNQKLPFSYPMKIGLIPTIAPYLLPKLLPLLKKQYPLARLQIVENQSLQLVDLVKRGELDAAVLALPFPCDGLLTLDFWEEDFYWIAPKGERFTDQQDITGEQLAQCNLLLLQEGHCLKDHIVDACNLAKQSDNQSFNATSLNTLIQMVLCHLGTTLIPAMAVDQLTAQHESLSVVHLKAPGPHRQLAFIIRPNFTRLSNIETLIDLAKQSLRTQLNQNN